MPDIKKIAVVAPVGPERGGIGNVAWHQARLLAARGQSVTVLTPVYDYSGSSRPSPQPSPEWRGGFAIELIKPLLKYGNAAWVPGLKKRLKDFNTVILHYPFFGGAGAVLAAKKRYGFKLLVYYHMDVVATLRQGFGWSSSLKWLIFKYNTKYFLPRLVKAADLVLTSSADLGKYSDLGKYWQENNSKFRVLPIGVDINKFAFSGQAREKMVLFVGVLDAAHYFKGLEILIRAIALVCHAGGSAATDSIPAETDSIASVARGDLRSRMTAPFKVVIIGDGDMRPHYKTLAAAAGVKNKIVFAGAAWGQDKIDWMQKALVTVLPSIDSESFGIVLVESMACGTPVIASDLPGVRSVFADGVSGFVVPPGDVEALAEKIEYALHHVEQMKTMGLTGRKLAEEKYDWEKIGNELGRLINDKFQSSNVK